MKSNQNCHLLSLGVKTIILSISRLIKKKCNSNKFQFVNLKELSVKVIN